MVEKSGSIDKEKLAMAWEHIYIAEGSDWCWWYGDEHSTENDADFDQLFRQNLINVYTLMGNNIPEILFKPIIISEKHVLAPFEASSLISPSIDGEVTSYFEWLGAAMIDLKKTGGTMHKSNYILSHIYCGTNKNFLFFRMDFNGKVECNGIEGKAFILSIKEPCETHFIIKTKENFQTELVVKPENKTCKYKVAAKLNDIIEIKIPMKFLEIKSGSQIDFYLSVTENGGELEKWPSKGFFTFKIPPEDFESKTWNAYA